MDLIHETISCASVFITFSGETKICDVEHCRRGGDSSKLFDSFSRMMMLLMDKTRPRDEALGLTRLQWSEEAIDFFTSTTVQPSLPKLLGHKFMERRDQGQLKWLVPFIMVSADHS